MRKITESTFVSLDGVTENPGAWATPYFSEHAQQAATQELTDSDGMLMGRGTYEYLAGAFPAQTGPYADAINSIRKYVFSATLDRAEWNNTQIIRHDALASVSELKHQEGRDLIMYGHGRLSQSLLRAGLIDEIRFAVHPLLVGHGPANSGDSPLELLGAIPLPSGVVAVSYRPIDR
jgi:dihydrofolate reductase